MPEQVVKLRPAAVLEQAARQGLIIGSPYAEELLTAHGHIREMVARLATEWAEEAVPAFAIIPRSDD